MSAERQAWNDAILLAASVAEGLNGWGSQTCPELAYHIAKCILACSLDTASGMSASGRDRGTGREAKPASPVTPKAADAQDTPHD